MSLKKVRKRKTHYPLKNFPFHLKNMEAKSKQAKIVNSDARQNESENFTVIWKVHTFEQVKMILCLCFHERTLFLNSSFKRYAGWLLSEMQKLSGAYLRILCVYLRSKTLDKLLRPRAGPEKFYYGGHFWGRSELSLLLLGPSLSC